MMKPDFKHTPRARSTNSALQLQKPSSTAPPPYAYLRKKSSLASQGLKSGNRLLAPGSKELVPLQQPDVKLNEANVKSSTCKEIVPFQPQLLPPVEKKNKLDGLILPDGQISVDKLLAQWADKIERAEQEFVLENIAFERARDRLKARNGRKILQALPQTRNSTMLLENAGRVNDNNAQELSLLTPNRPQPK